ncbi:MAG: putative YigZ family protein [Crocinitomicaceae bacterium]|jgi:uncharacterized YigZ family protein
MEYQVKRSRFIAFADHTKGIKSAKSFLHKLKANFPDARHHCYGFVAGHPNESSLYGFSDDNEPSGTAGMPIFTHLKHSGIGEISVVVVRYFGGTKLGTGGLARAYSEATKQVLEKLETSVFIETKKIVISCDFASEAGVRNKIKSVKGSVVNVKYLDNVKLTCLVPVNCELNLPYSVNSSA